VDPVVVIPDMLSKKASLKVSSRFEKINGSDPKMAILVQEREVNKKAYKILENYYKQGEFNEGRQKMAWTPSQAKLISNPTSGAPGFIIGNVYCLPGVPSILKSMLGG